MKPLFSNGSLVVVLMVLLSGLCVPAVAAPIIANHNAVGAFDAGIPVKAIDAAKNKLHIFYGHTSHGSQPLTGIAMLNVPYNSGLRLMENDGADLGHNGNTDWVQITKETLAANPTINVVLWSWCGGVADNTAAGINSYLNAMTQLEQQHPQVTFVYMTGRHWNQDGSAQVEGESAATNSHIEAMNNLIRSYASTHNKVLYDFADIEEYDPAGTRHVNTSDGCAWCPSWCATHGPTGCNADSCAHTHSYNCYIKGKAFWWMLARITGWPDN